MKQKLVIQWHITHACNLRCRHCYQEAYSKDLDVEDLENIFSQVQNYLRENNYIGHINFTGGEPLVSKHLWQLLDRCEKNNITFGILTNGTLMDTFTVEKLSQYKKLSFIQVSIDGVKATHDSIRGEGSFEKTMGGIKRLKKAKIQTMVSFTCSKSNHKELKDVIRLCEKAGVDRFWSDRLIPMGSNTLDIVSTEEYRDYMKILGDEARRAKKLPWIRTRVHTNRALQFLCGCGDMYECSAGKNLLTILADGTLLPCRRLPLELGNLVTDELENIIKNSEIIQELRADNIAEECKKCLMASKCKGGAKCLTYAVTGGFVGKDVNCPF